MTGRLATRAELLLAFLALLLVSCAHGPQLRTRVEGLNKVVDDAEKNGAMKCAPRELALAKAHLRFAATELDQGQLSNAEHHLSIAEPNARVALEVSPADRCSNAPVPGDRDGDGIPDSLDKCPDQPENYNGFEDADGCPDDPDTDGDGIPDSRDACPLEKEDMDGYLDEDGCPELDNDADGIADAKDRCPNQPEDPDGFQDEDGCPDPDNDQDTVADVEDMCPNTPGQPGGPRSGCPQLVMVTAREIRITQQIQFEFNKATIRPVSYPTLDAVRDVLVQNPQIKIEVQGHTDNVGNAAYNQKLSQQRADSVKAYLTSHGIEASRLTSKGYGMSQPIVPNTTEANRALNRRVQFIRTEGSPGK
jgi:outer membrane protein OmpA-like peptidoglycan-associated protein